MRSGSTSAALRGVLVAILLTILASAVPVMGFGGEALHVAMRDWAPAVVYLLAATVVVARTIRTHTDRGPWIVLSVGLVLYAAGNLLWPLWAQHIADPPIPSVCDVLWLSLYPASYVGLVWLAGGHGRRIPAGVWLDGLVAGLAVATIGAAFVFPPVLAAAPGDTAAVVMNLIYPVCDLLLVALVVGVASLRSWRLSVAWWCLGGGFSLLAVGDTIYLESIAAGSTDSSLVANLFYMAGVALIALAAWQRRSDPPAPRIHSWSILIVPATCAIGAIGILMADHFTALSDVAVLLAAATVIVALTRTALTFRDVRAMAEARRQAVTDDLTGLPNRRLFMQRADAAVATALATGGSAALLIIDLDHFKELNDTLGHHAGDTLLRKIGPRLAPDLGAGDTLARLGGDEFGLVLDGADEARTVSVAEQVLASLEAPFEISGLQLTVSGSVGISLSPAHGSGTTELMQRADVAMYEAKGARSGFQVYDGSRDRHSRENLSLLSELPLAIASGDLELHFQAKAHASTQRLAGAEALVRWRHPRLGLLAPDRFIPMVDRAGLGRQLTHWVLDTAVAEARAWRDAGHCLHIAVNVTVADLLDAGFPAQVAAALDRHGLAAGDLVVEVTETSVLLDPARADAILIALRELGVGVALDDFGTGYSSLSHLKGLPVTEVKIDRSFVAGMRTDAADAAIVSSTIGLAHGLGLRVVAEGVEDEATWRRLAELDCDLVQGYHLSRPLPGPAFAEFVRARSQAETKPRSDFVVFVDGTSKALGPPSSPTPGVRTPPGRATGW